MFRNKRSRKPDLDGRVESFDLSRHPPYALYWRLARSGPEVAHIAQSLVETCESAGVLLAGGLYGQVISEAWEPVGEAVDPNDAENKRYVSTLPGIVRICFDNHQEALDAGLPDILAMNEKLSEWVRRDRSVLALIAWYALYYQLLARLAVDLIVLSPPFDGTNAVALAAPDQYALGFADAIVASVYGSNDDDLLGVLMSGMQRVEVHRSVDLTGPPWFTEVPPDL